jgi:hypothetical protein
MGKHDSTAGESMSQAMDLGPAKHQWRRAAALAIDISRSDNVTLHQEAVRIARRALARIGALVEAAARSNGS